MEPECVTCGIIMSDEEKHLRWHENLRSLLQELVNAVYGSGFEPADAQVKGV